MDILGHVRQCDIKSCSRKTAGGGPSQKPLTSSTFSALSACSQVVHGTGPRFAERACSGDQAVGISESNLQIIIQRYSLD